MKRIYRDNILREIINTAMDAFIVIDPKGVVTEWNQRAVDLFGFSEEEAIGHPLSELIVPPALDIDHDKLVAAYSADKEHAIMNRRVEVPAKKKDGKTIPIELTVNAVEVDDHLFFGATVRDLTQHHRDTSELAKRARLINLSRDAIYVINRQREVILWSRGAEVLYGYSEEEALGKNVSELLNTKMAETGQDVKDSFETFLISGPWEGEIVHTTKDKRRVVVLSRWALDPETDEILITNTNITELRINQDRAEYLATHDSLTSLPNRQLLEDRASHAIAKAIREGKHVGVLMLDLNRFRVVNDSVGYACGNKMLKEIGQRILNAVRNDDTVSRLGGDEFAIILENMYTAEDIADVTRKIHLSISAPLSITGCEGELTIDTGIGVAVYPTDGIDVTTLLRNAELAMYQAKADHQELRFFSPEMNQLVADRLWSETSLRKAIENHEFTLHYQPKVDHLGHVIGAEALIRWNHPRDGLTLPGKFIPMAEEIGLIPQIGEWVLNSACDQARTWCDSGHCLKMSVNLSVHQLSGAIVNTVSEALARSGLDPKYLDLEITESAAMHDVESMLKMIDNLRDLGVSISIDDFGTGYSSLSYLKQMAVDCLKIDQTFVSGIPDDVNDQSIVTSIIALAHNMNLGVVAEGVTTFAQVAFLRALKCDQMQGYLFGKPMTVTDFSNQLLH